MHRNPRAASSIRNTRGRIEYIVAFLQLSIAPDYVALGRINVYKTYTIDSRNFQNPSSLKQSVYPYLYMDLQKFYGHESHFR
jgi:hypothetical protein